jgi:O-antigen/teichoic acid export membrane protein
LSETNLNPAGFTAQLPKNLIANIANFVLSIIIGIFLVPYFIGTLGIAAYGLIPLATSITGYVVILTDSLNVAVARFLTIDIHQEDYKKANHTFNTAFFGFSAISAFLIPCILLLSYFAPRFFNVPAGQETEVIFLFLGVFVSFVIRAWSSNFTVLLFAHNRLDLINLLNMCATGLQIILIVFLFSEFSPKLSYIGLAYLISTLIFLICAGILARRIEPRIKISVHNFDRTIFKDIMGMGGWAVVNQIGATLFLPTYLIVVNILFGATAAGKFSIPLQFVSVLYCVAAVFSGQFVPIIFSYYARKKTDELVKIVKSIVKFMSLIIALPVGFLCGFGPEIFTAWLGKEYAPLSLLLILLVLPTIYNTAAQPFFSINSAFNRLKVPGIVTLLAGVCNVLLAIILSLYTPLGYYGVAVAAAIMLFLKNGLFIPWYAARLLQVPGRTFFGPAIMGEIAAGVIALSGFALSQVIPISGVFLLIVTASAISLAYWGFIWAVGLTHFEHELLLSIIPKWSKRILNALPRKDSDM